MKSEKCEVARLAMRCGAMRSVYCLRGAYGEGVSPPMEKKVLGRAGLAAAAAWTAEGGGARPPPDCFLAGVRTAATALDALRTGSFATFARLGVGSPLAVAAGGAERGACGAAVISSCGRLTTLRVGVRGADR